jgi:hypothetical protein
MAASAHPSQSVMSDTVPLISIDEPIGSHSASFFQGNSDAVEVSRYAVVRLKCGLEV